jgi:hypothetical protein
MLRTLKPEDRNPKYLDGIMRCAQWTIDHRDDSGWFTNNNLIKGLPPLTHNIAYTLRGLLELGVMLENSTYITAVEQAANILIHDYQLNGYLAAGYGNHWKRGPSFRCITGEAQIGIIWFRLGQVTGNHKFILEANKILNQVLATQWMATPKNKALYGGIPGSAPLWAKYGRLAFPNWAAKFTADLLLYFELYT